MNKAICRRGYVPTNTQGLGAEIDAANLGSRFISADRQKKSDINPSLSSHVETVVLLFQRRPDTHIDIKLDLSELDVTAAETKAT